MIKCLKQKYKQYMVVLITCGEVDNITKVKGKGRNENTLLTGSYIMHEEV